MEQATYTTSSNVGGVAEPRLIPAMIEFTFRHLLELGKALNELEARLTPALRVSPVSDSDSLVEKGQDVPALVSKLMEIDGEVQRKTEYVMDMVSRLEI